MYSKVTYTYIYLIAFKISNQVINNKIKRKIDKKELEEEPSLCKIIILLYEYPIIKFKTHQ